MMIYIIAFSLFFLFFHQNMKFKHYFVLIYLIIGIFQDIKFQNDLIINHFNYYLLTINFIF